MATVTEVRVPEPLFSVKSRVSWGALLAGAVVAIAMYSLLSMLGIAVAFTVSDQFEAQELGVGAAIWTVISLLLAMFLGGWVATRCTAGEFRTEAVLYGIVVWGITSILLVPLTAAGVGMGTGTALADRGIAKFNNTVVPPMVNTARVVSDKVRNAPNGGEEKSASKEKEEDSSKDSTSTENSSDRDRISSDRSSSDRNSNDRSSSDRSTSTATSTDDSDRGSDDRDSTRSRPTAASVREHLRTVSWWTFAGTLASMIAAIAGALLGPHVVVTQRNYAPVRPVA